MTDTKEPDQKKPLSLSNTLSLKKSPEAEQVRQSFSHGRSKPVTVEVKKKRINMPGTPEPVAEAPKVEVVQPKPSTQASQRPQKPQQGGRRLSNQEQEARMRAVQAAMQGAGTAQDPQQKAREMADQERRRMIEEQKRAQEEALLAKTVAEEAKVVEETIVETQPVVVVEKVKPAVQPDPSHFIKKKSADDEEEERKSKVRGGHGPAHAGPKKSFEGRRANSKSFGSGDEDGAGRVRSMAALKRAREKEYRRNHQQESTQKVFREVVLPETISVQELANRMTERAADVVKTLMKMGMMVTINQVIDADTAELVVAEMGHKVKRVSEADIELALKVSDDDRPEDLLPRAPVVTVMGHVDHGKTSLLDALRQTDIVSGEAGGITQHIGAYQVHLPSGKNITFVDTPGHAAFTEMRARGANITDVVILVVAADDGIMEQTIEAIHHAKAAGVPIVVAINKMDKPDANPDRVRNELLSHDIVLEEFGGDVMAVEVSAKAKLNLDKLEEAVLLQAEILDLKANPNRAAEGAVVEARIEKGRGSVATVLIQKGTLKVGDIFVAGCEWGRVRALYNDHGRKIEEAFPSEPVEVLGFDGTPGAGDDFVVVESENKAREIAEFRTKRSKDMRMAKTARGSMEQMFSQIGEGSQRILSVVIKSDVQGSLEAITTSLAKLETPEVNVKVLHAAVGGINESDVILARASNAFVVGFNVRANPQARELSGRDGVDIRYYSIIYDVIDDMKAALSGLLSPTIKEQFLGYAEIREVFNITKVGKIAGCMITSGVVKRGAKVRLLRDNIVIHEGSLKTLKRFKDEVKEAKEGFECGMAFENYHDIRTGDVIECFEMEEIARTL